LFPKLERKSIFAEKAKKSISPGVGHYDKAAVALDKVARYSPT
jgi:hypothetical protein